MDWAHARQSTCGLAHARAFALIALVFGLAAGAMAAEAQGLAPLQNESLRRVRDDLLPRYGAWGLGGVVVLLAVFFLLRGRVAIELGWAGLTLRRFGRFERAAHWLLALSFVVLALTGLNVLYGRQVLLPLVGAEAWAEISSWAAWLHVRAGFGFMGGLALIVLPWLRHALPSWRDIVWLAKGGGLLVRGSLAPAWKFNAGQKVLFWLVLVGGLAVSLTGVALLSPFRTALMSKVFAGVNALGVVVGLAPGLPVNLTPSQEMEHSVVWHGIIGLGLIGVVIGHIYMRTLGLQGAFRAMASGEVDVNWARQHHSLWADRQLEEAESEAPPRATLAE